MSTLSVSSSSAYRRRRCVAFRSHGHVLMTSAAGVYISRTGFALRFAAQGGAQ